MQLTFPQTYCDRYIGRCHLGREARGRTGFSVSAARRGVATARRNWVTYHTLLLIYVVAYVLLVVVLVVVVVIVVVVVVLKKT